MNASLVSDLVSGLPTRLGSDMSSHQLTLWNQLGVSQPPAASFPRRGKGYRVELLAGSVAAGDLSARTLRMTQLSKC
ncbi:hypothetical protein EYF80_032135 [Liparis tanakae]|uniref:Uncharacterized protein n=1 Tax=Liparis tanakae TaxID=230148 RepID=A0A4Z2GY26_9TELE|nr:hypothetical protein EYF80_032135 [Liparis tanakae]